jgi:hypothetical protein
VEALEALLEGIEPEWWRRTLGKLLPADGVLAVYAAGSARWDSVIGLLELRGNPVVLAVARGSMLGMRFGQIGERSSIHVDKWSLSLDLVSSVASSWDTWFDRREANVSGIGHFSGTIQLDSPLGDLGAEITLPVDRREDYGGRTEVSEGRAMEFTRALEAVIARGSSAPGGHAPD